MSGEQKESTGMFCMSVVQRILEASSLQDAKDIAVDAIKKCGIKIKKVNVNKAKAMIGNSKNQQHLAFGMSNFILAFQGEKVIK